MQRELTDLGQEPMAKMNSSNADFKALIESLRLKNQRILKKTYSDINPESEQSNLSQACFSEVPINENAAPQSSQRNK